MEGDAPAGAKGKRKAEAASPIREEHGLSSMVTDNDRKRLNLSCQGDLVTATAAHTLLPPPEAADNSDHHCEQSSENEDDGDHEDENDEEGNDEEGSDADENDEDENDEDENDDDENDDDENDDDESFEGDLSIFDILDNEEEDTSPPELEVEEKEHFVGGSDETKVVFKIYLQEDDDEFKHWMQTIQIRCNYEGKDIGGGCGRYVRRDMIRSHFWRDMEEPCQELSEIAFDIFDRYGRLKEELKSHAVRKGSGIWGSELDVGSFFVIECMLIDKAWRRKGLGSQLVDLLMSKAQAGDRKPRFTLVIPSWINRDIANDIDGKTQKEKHDIRQHANHSARAFYRSLGFRRIGASYCFGLATDPNHQARALSSEADFNPLRADADTDEPPEGYQKPDQDISGDFARSSWRLKLLEERLPLHHAATTLPDIECVKFFQEFKKSEKPIGDWVKLDRFSKNVLHIAAGESKVQSVRWLLFNADSDEKLSSARDIQGYTPLEELESAIETRRSILEHGMMRVVILDQFRGYPAEIIGCLAALRKLTNPSKIQYLQMKYGCTCGECIDGFLSPRMKFALLCAAEISHDLLHMEVGDGELWTLIHSYMIEHVAADIQQNFRTNKSYRQGYSNIFEHAADTLRANKAPTVINVLHTWGNSSEWPPVTRNFFQRGGNAESALRVVFEHAQDQDEYAGDGELMAASKDKIINLPKCRNDHEFEFVALACGMEGLSAGRYLPIL